MKRIVLVLVFAVGVAACGAESADTPPTPTAQPTATPLPTPRPKPTARPSPTRAAQPTPVPLREYVIQPGDTLYSLARRFGVDLRALAEFNRIADPRKIYVGQRLLVPSDAIVAATPPARPTPPRVHGVDCEFRFGFKELYDLIPATVGQCLENEEYNVSGDSFQRTTNGLLVWRKADNRTTFTDGSWTWIHGPDGLEKKRNSDRFVWDPPDPLLAQVLETLRTTPTGERVYTLFMQSGATAQFEPSENFVSRYFPFRNLIVINEQYRNESPEALAHTLIWPVVGLHNGAERAQSWSECMERVIDQETAQAQWWRELFGEGGKSYPTDLERWANHEVTLLVNESLRHWVQLSPHFREQCARYGAPPQRIDPTLAKAYRTALMGGESALGKAAAAMVFAAETDVVFGPSDGWDGRYSPIRNRIEVNEELRDASADVLAAVLIHETLHVAQYQERSGRRSPAECVEDEIEAFAAEAQWWAEQHGDDGKEEQSEAERHLNGLLLAWQLGMLEAFVLLSDNYQEQCLGGVVNS